jgi:hypothetical protein
MRSNPTIDRTRSGGFARLRGPVIVNVSRQKKENEMEPTVISAVVTTAGKLIQDVTAKILVQKLMV